MIFLLRLRVLEPPRGTMKNERRITHENANEAEIRVSTHVNLRTVNLIINQHQPHKNATEEQS
eukprot:scaffold31561_cov153-Amphora_coffeaeformis.AAC.3